MTGDVTDFPDGEPRTDAEKYDAAVQRQTAVEGIVKGVSSLKRGRVSDQEKYHETLQHQNPGAAADELGYIANQMLGLISPDHPHREGEARRWARKVLDVLQDTEAAGIGDQERHAVIMDAIQALSDTHEARGYYLVSREVLRANRKRRLDELFGRSIKGPPKPAPPEAKVTIKTLEAIDGRLGRIERALRMRRRVRS